MSDNNEHKINRYIANREKSLNPSKAKITRAIVDLSGADAFMKVIVEREGHLKGFETPADCTNFYFENKAVLMTYSKSIAVLLGMSHLKMLAGMSYHQKLKGSSYGEEQVKAVFIDDDRHEPLFPALTSNFVANIVGGIGVDIKNFLNEKS